MSNVCAMQQYNIRFRNLNILHIHTHHTPYSLDACAKERITNAIFSSTNKREAKNSNNRSYEIAQNISVCALNVSVSVCVYFVIQYFKFLRRYCL